MCDIVDEGVAVLSNVRVMIGDEGLSFEGRVSLQMRLERLSEVQILPQAFMELHASETAAFSNYITQVSDRFSTSGLATMSPSSHRDFVTSLTVLERFGGCVEPDEISPVEIYDQSGSAPSEAVQTMSDSGRVSPDTPVSGLSSQRSVSQNQGELRPAKIDSRDSLTVNYLTLFGMLAGAVLAMIYFVRKRPKPRETRRIIHAPARVRLGSKVHDMRIIDITANGCKIEHSEQIEKHRKLQIELDGVWYAGQVKWHNSAFAGVKFHRVLEVDVFNRVVRAALV